MQTKQLYLIALPCFKGAKGFSHPTILVKATNSREALAIARHLRPCDNLGDVKLVKY